MVVWLATDCLASVKPADPDNTKFEQNEALAKQTLGRTIPDSILWHIMHKQSMADMWATIALEFKSKTALMQADLRAKFQTMTCPQNGNVRLHLNVMHAMHEN